MKKLLVIVLVASLLGIAGTASAAKKWDDMSWWGKTGATPDPVKDSKGRAGCWWQGAQHASAGRADRSDNSRVVYRGAARDG